MDDQLKRKIGEVKAFTLISIKFLDKTHKTLVAGLGNKKVEELEKNFKELENNLSDFTDVSHINDVVDPKAEKTITKLERMQDIYINDSRDDIVELCEWLGFFLGAAIIHWNLVAGKAKKQSQSELSEITFQGIKINEDFFADVSTIVKSL